MRVEVTADERAVLLADFAQMLDTVEYAYRLKGFEWDRYDPANPDYFTVLTRAHDDLAHVDPPWALDGTRGDLEELLTTWRDGSSAGLRMGAKVVLDMAPWNLAFPERTDALLDTVTVCDAVLKRMLAAAD
jgi:hypothetical protein